jgi:hypothetical protein
MEDIQPCCVYCDLTSNEIPLINMQYLGKQVWICPQHLPILIHKPALLAEKLPGVERIASLGEEG